MNDLFVYQCSGQLYGDIDKMVADAQKIKARSFQVMKIKLGEKGEKDIERVRMHF